MRCILMMQHLLLFIVAFAGMFLRGHQTMAVVEGNILHAFVISWLITFSAVATLLMTVDIGYAALLPSGLGSSLGICFSIYIKNKEVT